MCTINGSPKTFLRSTQALFSEELLGSRIGNGSSRRRVGTLSTRALDTKLIPSSGEVNIRPDFTILSLKDAPSGSRVHGPCPTPSGSTTSTRSLGTYGYIFDITVENHRLLRRHNFPQRVKINVTVNTPIGPKIDHAAIRHVQVMTFFDCKYTIEGDMKFEDAEERGAVHQEFSEGAMKAHCFGVPLRYLQLAKEVIDGRRLPMERFSVVRAKSTFVAPPMPSHVEPPMPMNAMIEERHALPIARPIDDRGIQKVSLFEQVAARNASHNGSHMNPPTRRGNGRPIVQVDRARSESSSSSDEDGTGMIEIPRRQNTKGNGNDPRQRASNDVQHPNNQHRYWNDGEMANNVYASHHMEIDSSGNSSHAQAYRSNPNLPTPPVVPSNARSPCIDGGIPPGILPSQGYFPINTKTPPVALMSTKQPDVPTTSYRQSIGTIPPQRNGQESTSSNNASNANPSKRPGSSNPKTSADNTNPRPSMAGSPSRQVTSNITSRTTSASGTSRPSGSSNTDVDKRSASASTVPTQQSIKDKSNSRKRSPDPDSADPSSEHTPKRRRSSSSTIIKLKLPTPDKRKDPQTPSSQQSKRSDATITDPRSIVKQPRGSAGSPTPSRGPTSKNKTSAKSGGKMSKEKTKPTSTPSAPAPAAPQPRPKEKVLASGISLKRRKASMKNPHIGNLE